MQIIDFTIIKYIDSIENIYKKGLIITDKKYRWDNIEIPANSVISAYKNIRLGGKTLIDINIVQTNLFLHHFKDLVKWDNTKFIVDQETDCPFAVKDGDKFESSFYIWHNDHFDVWDKSYTPFINRIKSEPKIIINDLEISSLRLTMSKDKKLIHYITVKDIGYKTENYSIILPPYLEVACNSYGIITSLVPVENWEYSKAIFQADLFLTLQSDGTISGRSAISFEIDNIKFPEGVQVYVKPDGTTYSKAIDPKTSEMKIFYLS